MLHEINDLGISLIFLLSIVLGSDVEDESNSPSGGPGGPMLTVTISHSQNHQW